MLRIYNDDDIEVLGSAPMDFKSQRRTPGRVIFIVGAAAAVFILVLCFVIWHPAQVDDAIEVVEPAEIESEIILCTDTAMALPTEVVDSINDVVFTMINLEGFAAQVTFERPDSLAASVVVATPAADIRADNGEIVCEFIHEGEKLSRGERKRGFCYVAPDGTTAIGIGDGEQYRQAAMEQGGTFFRQLALVMDGEIQYNVLKGKALRRALAFIDNRPVLVLSKNRESIYDFSQMLADYGFSHAIYLPGGRGFLKLNTDKSEIYNNPSDNLSEYSNYLIFSK